MFENVSALRDPRTYLQQFQGLHGQGVHGRPPPRRGEAPAEDEGAMLAGPASRKVLNQQIMQALDEALARDGAAPIRSLDPEDFTPEKVADRVLGFIGRAIGLQRADGADEGTLQGLMQQARDGVERGFADARSILDGLGVLKDDIADDVDRTYDLIQNGLDRLENGAPSGGTVAGLQSLAYSQQRSLSLEVRTRDGDLITIRLDQQASADSTRLAVQGGDGALFVSQDRAEARVALEFRVQGELDEQERTALGDLLQGIDQIADDFYSKGGPEALRRALELDYDGAQLAGYTLDLNQSVTTQVTQAYRSVGRPDAPGGSLLQPFAALAGGLFGMGGEGGPASLLADPASALPALLEQRVEADSRYPDRLAPLGEPGRRLLDGLLQNLLAGMPGPAGTAPAQSGA